jgi:hypothetical protein
LYLRDGNLQFPENVAHHAADYGQFSPQERPNEALIEATRFFQLGEQRLNDVEYL